MDRVEMLEDLIENLRIFRQRDGDVFDGGYSGIRDFDPDSFGRHHMIATAGANGGVVMPVDGFLQVLPATDVCHQPQGNLGVAVRAGHEAMGDSRCGQEIVHGVFSGVMFTAFAWSRARTFSAMR